MRSRIPVRVRRLMILLLGTVALSAGLTVGAAPAHAYAYSNCNVGSSDIHVIHHQDGSYALGWFDAYLPPGGCTHTAWTTVAGYWIPKGYYVNEYDHDDVFIRTVSACGVPTTAGLYRWWPTSVSRYKTYLLRRKLCL